MLEAKNITFRYGNDERDILQDFNFCLSPGERKGLLAPSGFGKTTLCKILAGYQRPDQGVVLLDGRPLYPFKGYCPVQMVWQHPEAVLDPRMRMKATLAEGKVDAGRILPQLGIRREWLERYPHELSGGELQRFAIARALGQDTRFLLADEISAMLDAVTQAQIWQFLLHELAARNTGLLTVSHSESLLKQLCGENVLYLREKMD